MKAVLFARVSSKDQEETGYSLPSQQKLLKSYAERKKFRIAKVFSISESASGKSQREIFNEMMNYLQKQNIKIIICEKVDRLTRNFKDAVLIDDWLEKDEEKQVHLVKDSLILHKNSRSQEKLNWGIRILFAKNYIDNLKEEIKKGQEEKLAQGWIPAKPPLGFRTVGEKGHKIHVVDEDKAPFVRKMFELYVTGNYSIKKLSDIMYKEGLRTRGGNKLIKSRLHELLTDPFYYGKIRWNDKIYDGKHEPLISKEIFDKVQEILKSKTTPKFNKHFYLFKKLIRCAECGGLITWEKQKGIIYGHCNHYRNCSQKTWVTEPKIEGKISEVLGELELKSPKLVNWIRKALKESHQDEINYRSSTLKELNTRLKQVEKRMDNLYDDKLDENITPELYKRKFKQYTEEKETIVQAIQKYSQASNKYFELGVNIYELSQKAKKLYLKATLEEKRRLISLVFSKIKLDEGNLTYQYSELFAELSKAILATNSSKEPLADKSPSKIFEPRKFGYNHTQFASSDSELCALLWGQDSNL